MGRRGLDLKKTLVPLVRAAYVARARKVNVMTSDPRTELELPCVAVNRIYDSEDQQGFANVYDEVTDPSTEGNVENLSGLFTQNVELRIWTENADQRDDMFDELKEILISLKSVLAEKGFGTMRVFGGRDENDFRTYSPLFIYWGVLQFTALSPLDVFGDPNVLEKPILSITETVVATAVSPQDLES